MTVMSGKSHSFRSRETEAVSDLADKASQHLERAIEATLASMRWQIDRQAEIAKSRRGTGKDGFCEDCGDSIPPARLKATQGTATKCRLCQETAEFKSGGRRGYRFGH